MPAFRHLLVPIDFGETSDDVIDAAVEMAKRFDAHITLAHVFSISPMAYGDGFAVSLDDVLREARSTMDSMVDKVRKRHPDVDGVLVRGAPWEEILHLTKSQGADLIVMGTHGRRGLSRVFLGSVAERIVRLSPIPVLTVAARRDSDEVRSISAISETVPRSCHDNGA